MKKYLLFLLLFIISAACRVNFNKTIKGNGRMEAEERNFSDLSMIKIRGGINVEVSQGSTSMRIEADENLLKYIETYQENGWIIIKTKDNVNLKSSHPIRVFISTQKLSDVNIAGSGNLKGLGKFSGAGSLNLDIAGSGDISLDVNTPQVDVGIRGSGSVTLSGETKDARIDIAGSGDYRAADLLTENTDIEIHGSGDAKVYADNSIKADVLGSGTVFYRGKAKIQSSSSGSGKIKPME